MELRLTELSLSSLHFSEYPRTAVVVYYQLYIRYDGVCCGGKINSEYCHYVFGGNEFVNCRQVFTQ